jgi:hypothetical protein
MWNLPNKARMCWGGWSAGSNQKDDEDKELDENENRTEPAEEVCEEIHHEKISFLLSKKKEILIQYLLVPHSHASALTYTLVAQNPT